MEELVEFFALRFQSSLETSRDPASPGLFSTFGGLVKVSVSKEDISSVLNLMIINSADTLPGGGANLTTCCLSDKHAGPGNLG